MNNDKRTVENPFDKAARVAERVQLVDVCLLSSKTFQDRRRAKANLETRFEFTPKTWLSQIDSNIVVIAKFQMMAVPSQSRLSSPCVAIEAEFSLTYKLDSIKEYSRKDVECFGQINGIYNAWPYWREFVQNATARMGHTPFVIPVFRFSDFAKKKN